MKYDIWQMPISNKRKFRDLDEFDDPINLADYVHVYTGWIDKEDLEEIFYILNQEHPNDYHAHSLSVSDLIQIGKKFYYVDGIGFKEVNTCIS